MMLVRLCRLATHDDGLYPNRVTIEISLPKGEAPKNCSACPRLVGLRRKLRKEQGDWWNAPVPSWGDPDAWLAVVGLAPGMKGANRTGRPFTGDQSGMLLFDALERAGFCIGQFGNRADDGLRLNGAMIMNAVKCLPPENLPTGDEISNCRKFLGRQIGALDRLRVLIAVGKVAHDSILKYFGRQLVSAPFGHGHVHLLPSGRVLIDSYHCSRYNVQTGRLTPEMFYAIFRMARELNEEGSDILDQTAI